MVFPDISRGTLVLHRSWKDGIWHDLVLVRLSQHSPHHGNICDWQGLRQPRYTGYRLRYDCGSDHYMDTGLWHDDPSDQEETTALAAKGRGSR